MGDPLDGERARATERAWVRERERLARLLLNGDWTKVVAPAAELDEPASVRKPRRGLWGATKAELLEVARERWPHLPDPESVVAAAQRIREAETSGTRRVDPEAWMAGELQYAQSWVHDWREKHPRGTVEEAWRAFELAEGVRKVKRSSFGIYFQQVELPAERLRAELKIPAPHGNGANGPERLEPSNRGAAEEAFDEQLRCNAREVLEVAATIDVDGDVTPDGASFRKVMDDVEMTGEVMDRLELPREHPEAKDNPVEVLIRSRRGEFQAYPAEDGSWELQIRLTRASALQFDELFNLARALLLR